MLACVTVRPMNNSFKNPEQWLRGVFLLIGTLPTFWAWRSFILIILMFCFLLDSRYPDSRISGFLDFQIPGFPDFQISGQEGAMSQDNLPTTFGAGMAGLTQIQDFRTVYPPYWDLGSQCWCRVRCILGILRLRDS